METKTVTHVLPEWAPDDCPPNVVRLVEDEQYLEDLGLRGLASADSAELHQAVRNLRGQLAGAFRLGRKAGPRMPAIRFYLAAGFVMGALSVAVPFLVWGPS